MVVFFWKQTVVSFFSYISVTLKKCNAKAMYMSQITAKVTESLLVNTDRRFVGKKTAQKRSKVMTTKLPRETPLDKTQVACVILQRKRPAVDSWWNGHRSTTMSIIWNGKGIIVASKSDTAMLTTNKFIVVLMLTFFTTTAMMRVLPVRESAKMKASIVVMTNTTAVFQIILVSVVRFTVTIFCCFSNINYPLWIDFF